MPKHVMTYTKRKTAKKRKAPKNSVEAVKTCGQYWVEEILDHAIDTDGRLKYLLKWEGYDDTENSWEYDQHLNDCTDIRNTFRTTVNGKHPPMYSWDEFDNFCHYLKRAVSPDFTDTGVVHKLSDKAVAIWELKDQKKLTQTKATIRTNIKELLENAFDERDRNSQRLRATVLASKVAKNLKIEQNFGSIRRFIEFVDRRAKIETKLKKWSDKVNHIIKVNGEGTPISVANDVDDEVPTLDHYICESVFDKNKFPNKSVAEQFTVFSCECDDCYVNRQECCPPIIGFPMAYNSKTVLSHSLTDSMNVIFECNVNCKCGPDCANRVVQRGRKYKLELFRTEDAANRGWGVRTMEAIPKGAYVSTYVGEVVSLTEANQRPTTYLFDLSASWDQTDNEFTYVIDADKYGNILRYVNHSCEPNCRMIFVWTDSYDRLLPKVCLFTTRSIRANEELTYDYGMQIINLGEPDQWEQSDTISTDSGNASNDTDNQTDAPLNSSTTQTLTDEKSSKVAFKEIECRCGSKKCRKILYS